MYECKQCKQKLNKYYNFILRILGCRNAGMQEIQKNELYAEKKAPAVPLLREPFFYSFYFFILNLRPSRFRNSGHGQQCCHL